MAVAISKSISIGEGGVTLAYWKLDPANGFGYVQIGNTVLVQLVPFVTSNDDTGSAKPAMRFSRSYELTLAQAGLGATGLGGKNVGNFLRDTILAWLLANHSDFSGGTLV